MTVLTVPSNEAPSCTDVERLLCSSVAELPLGWRQRRKRRQQLLEAEYGHCTMPAPFERLLNVCSLYASQYRAQSNVWGRLHYLLGLPATILATTAGATALSSMTSQVVTATLSLAAATISATATFLRTESSRDRSLALLGGWIALADQVRNALMQYRLDVVQSSTGPDQHKYLERLVQLNEDKCLLLSGKLRAGPEDVEGKSRPT